MATLALSAAAAALSPFPLGGWPEKKMFSPNGWTKKTSSSFCAKPRRGKGPKCDASGSTGSSGGVVSEVSEGGRDPRLYAWPDNKDEHAIEYELRISCSERSLFCDHRKKPRICILGGGFGGLYTALRLESLMWDDDKRPQVLLIDQSERFVFKPMLYELLSGEVEAWEIAPRFSDLVANTSIQFFKDRVKMLHPCDHLGRMGLLGTGCSGKVLLESGLLIEYDWLVLALGAEAKLDVIPGAAEFAFPFTTLKDACKVSDRLKDLERRRFGKDAVIKVAVVGCGYSGVELAATLSERLQDRGIVQAINVETTILPNAPPGNREVALKVLSSRKVQLLLGYFVRSIQRVTDPEAAVNGMPENRNSDRYCLELQPVERGSANQILEADIVLFTVGSKPPLPQLESPRQSFPLNARGQTETDETLQVKGHPRIFAIGDSSALRDSSGRLLPSTAQVAFQQADFTGWNLWAAINDRPLLPFRFQNLGEMMTLGRNDAAVSPSFLEGLTLEGPIGHSARKLAYLIRLPTDEHRVKVGLSWLARSAVDSAASFQKTMTEIFSSQ